MPDAAGRTRLKMTLLEKRVAALGAAANGALPLSLDELRLATKRDSGLIYDVWRRPIKYVPRDTDFELRSAGADGAFGTNDVVVTGRLPNSK